MSFAYDDVSPKLKKLTDKLPECCQPFFYETSNDMADTTAVAYARELSVFFDYLIYTSPNFCDLSKEQITLDHIREITPQDISRYITYSLRGLKLAERTVARRRAAISSFFAYLIRLKLIDYNPALASSKVHITESESVVHLEMSEQLDLLKTVDDGTGLTKKQMSYHGRYQLRDYALILLLLDTGMRVSELHGINIEHLNLKKCSVHITRKERKEQDVYFSDETVAAIQDYLDERNSKFPVSISEPLFVTLKGDRLSVRAIQALVKKYATSALPGTGSKMSPHKMRASFAMSFYRANKDILALQKKMGHKTLTATNIYAKATDEEMEQTRSLLEDARNQMKGNING